MTKIFLPIFSIFFLLVLAVYPVLAKTSDNPSDNDIPERDGVYDVPGRADLKVRVFVHEPRPARGTSEIVLQTCGLTDPDSSTVVPSAGWRLPSNWSYQLNLGSVPASVGSANLPAIASNAFSQWTDAASGKVNITRGANTTISRKGFDGHNIVAWGQTSGTALAVTYAWYYPSTGLAAEEDVIFNKKFKWGWNGGGTNCAIQGVYDAQNILTHELGHWMGLNDTYDASFTNNTMFGYGSTTEVKKNTLTTGDRAGILAIYP